MLPSRPHIETRESTRRLHSPAVSVIVPCHNGESTIADTLESLQQQTFGEWEAIVINDGSTDSSPEIIRNYGSQDSRIRQVDQDNQGLGSARNAGLAVARGEFVLCLDADDLLLPNALRRMVRALKKHPSFGAVHCGWIHADPTAQDLRWVVSPQREPRPFGKLAHRNLFPCHAVMLRREILENVGPFDASLKHCHDWDLWLRVARTGTRFGRVPLPLVVYRMMAGSLSRNPLTFFEAGREVIRRGHRPDDRVRDPAPEFARGCGCSMKEAILSWSHRCIAFAIAQGDAAHAADVVDKIRREENLQMSPKSIGKVQNDLWFAAAVPRGDWEALCRRLGTALLQFLLQEEDRLGAPGFAMQSMLEIARWQEPPTGRALLVALLKKLVRRRSLR